MSGGTADPRAHSQVTHGALQFFSPHMQYIFKLLTKKVVFSNYMIISEMYVY